MWSWSCFLITLSANINESFNTGFALIIKKTIETHKGQYFCRGAVNFDIFRGGQNNLNLKVQNTLPKGSKTQNTFCTKKLQNTKYFHFMMTKYKIRIYYMKPLKCMSVFIQLRFRIILPDLTGRLWISCLEQMIIEGGVLIVFDPVTLLRSWGQKVYNIHIYIGLRRDKILFI